MKRVAGNEGPLGRDYTVDLVLRLPVSVEYAFDIIRSVAPERGVVGVGGVLPSSYGAEKVGGGVEGEYAGSMGNVGIWMGIP